MANNRLTWDPITSQVDSYSDAGRLGVLASMGLGQAFADTGKAFSDMHSEAAARDALQYLVQSWDPNNRQSFNEALPLAIAANPGMSSEMLKYLTGAGRTLMNAQLDADNLAIAKERAKIVQNAIDVAKANGDVSALHNANTAAGNLGLRPDAITFRSIDAILNDQAARASQYAAIDANRRAAKKEVEDRVLQDNKAGALKAALGLGLNQVQDPQVVADAVQSIASRFSTNNKEYMEIVSHLNDNISKFGATDYSRYFNPSVPFTITTFDPNNPLAGTSTRQVAPITREEIVTNYAPTNLQQTQEERLKNAELFEQQVNSILEPVQVQTTAQSIPSTPPKYDPSDPIRSGAAIVEWQKNRTKQNNSSSSKQQINPTYATVTKGLVDLNNTLAQVDYTPQGQRKIVQATNSITQAANSVRKENNASKRAYLLNGTGADITPEIVEAETQYANAVNNKATEADLANIAAQYNTADGQPMSVNQLGSLSPQGMFSLIEKYLQNKEGERVVTDSDKNDILRDIRTMQGSSTTADMSDVQKAANNNLIIRSVIAGMDERSAINPIGLYADMDYDPEKTKKLYNNARKGATESNSPFNALAQTNLDIQNNTQQIQTATANLIEIQKSIFDLKLKEQRLAKEGRTLSWADQARLQNLVEQYNLYSDIANQYGFALVQSINQYNKK